MNGRQPSITVRRYALNALVVSFSGDPEQQPDHEVRDPIENQLDPRIVDRAAARP